ncbi:unnamed protein product [Kuraishia capsulata CBS 1993]|uniref:Amino acid permease/ SLC12A domain-containing protein n=1 Tax=Kuraishia capsulata CBS 1993 TaxID=1382522 RepID=W6MLH7_9ASCO|nr:uncharacterized protein KUCA_T00001642001 [Kuraishia capsulata CBS 1993]CDK25672.1 unnamed protein product [Kuraishia capsulata CBS 1993]
MLSAVKSTVSVQRLEGIHTQQSQIRDIDARHVANDDDLLAEIGYKAELKRTFSTFQIFGIAYSIMGLLPSIASTAGIGLTAGASGLVWSWFVAGFFILLIGIGMSELSSAIPTSGGLYYWTHYYAPEKYRIPVSFVIGLSNTMALCSGLCSINYGFAQEVTAAVFINSDNTFEITQPRLYGIFAACTVSHILITSLSSKHISYLQSTSIVCNTGLIVLYFIALPVGTAKNSSFNGGKFIFGNLGNFESWTTGWQFMLSMMTCVWTIGSFDSCVHMSEEAKNASRGVPAGIIGSIFVCWVVGWFICICTAACMSSDVGAVLDTETGFAMAQIVYDSLGKRWAVAMMSLMAFCQWLMGASILAALSRQVWAFARDDGLPFCSFVKVVNKKLRVPIRAVWFGGILALIIGCLTFAGSTAASALFSLAVSGNYLAWGTPIFLRLTSGKSRFRPGPFYLGKISEAVNWVVCLWIVFIIILCMFPTGTTVDETTMNYTVVISCGTWLLSILYFYVYKYKNYHGPASNLADPAEEAVESVDNSYEVTEKV